MTPTPHAIRFYRTPQRAPLDFLARCSCGWLVWCGDETERYGAAFHHLDKMKAAA